MTHTHDGISRCEICDLVTPADRLTPCKLGFASDGTRDVADLCCNCERRLEDMSMSLRARITRNALESAVGSHR
jgi:hypothetical protein